MRQKFVGALRLPGDETGDCFKFTQRLASMAEKLGVEFRYGVTIDQLRTEAGRITGVTTSLGDLNADAYVLALGSYSPVLLRGISLRVPIYPIKGYSITVPITDSARAPESTIMDENLQSGDYPALAIVFASAARPRLPAMI